jgi:MoxR-like ATPase
MTEWLAYTGKGRPDSGAESARLPDPPPWREFLRPGAPDDDADGRWRERSDKYQIEAEDVSKVNAALYLRRPLLVTGEPGTGKTSLAYSVARELGLGTVLRWPVNSKTTLRDGLYHYDAIGRLQEANIRETEARRSGEKPAPVKIGDYIRLGPLGTALLPSAKPRVLLVDEFDKSDIDLPNDLLDVLEEGEFRITELERLPLKQSEKVLTIDNAPPVEIPRGRVRCDTFPLVIITSNGEREFPSAFMRRCLLLNLRRANGKKLEAIVRAHLGEEALRQSGTIIAEFLKLRDKGELATDQLLNAIHLRYKGLRPPNETPEELAKAVMHYLDRPAG